MIVAPIKISKITMTLLYNVSIDKLRQVKETI